MNETWVEWRPRWAPHVRGEHTERTVDPETHQADEQKYKITCERCGETWGPSVCTSGLVRTRIANFAVLHAHRNPLMDPIPKP